MTTDWDALAGSLDEIPDLEVERDAPAGPLCTYRVGGPIRVLVRAETPEALLAMANADLPATISTQPLGKGSNLLVSDAGFEGIGVLLGSGFAETTFDGVHCTAGAGAMLPLVARATVRQGLTGFEWAVGVPGTIGGGVRMNAGGHGSDISANLVSVEMVDLSTGVQQTVSATELDLGYRTSNVGLQHVVISATLALADADADVNGEEALSEIVRWRRQHQPGGQNAGSVFTNPPDDSAGRLIDEAGMKGHRVRTAEVSTVHANFIQADPDGSADDVMALMKEIVETVEAASGIRLHAETRLVGFSDHDVEWVQPSKDGAS